MDAGRAYTEHLEGIVTFLPYMAVVDAFQHWVYTEAPEDVTADQLDATWSALWDRFMQDVDYGGLGTQLETGWHRKLHIFTVPFYYVEYGLAQLGALQVWRNALRDQAQAVAGYRSALALGYAGRCRTVPGCRRGLCLGSRYPWQPDGADQRETQGPAREQPNSITQLVVSAVTWYRRRPRCRTENSNVDVHGGTRWASGRRRNSAGGMRCAGPSTWRAACPHVPAGSERASTMA